MALVLYVFAVPVVPPEVHTLLYSEVRRRGRDFFMRNSPRPRRRRARLRHFARFGSRGFGPGPGPRAASLPPRRLRRSLKWGRGTRTQLTLARGALNPSAGRGCRWVW